MAKPPVRSKRASLDPMERPNEATEEVPPMDPGDENPFPLTTEWCELQRHEATENAMRRKAERERDRAAKDRTRSRKSGFLWRWRSRPSP